MVLGLIESTLVAGAIGAVALVALNYGFQSAASGYDPLSATTNMPLIAMWGFMVGAIVQLIIRAIGVS